MVGVNYGNYNSGWGSSYGYGFPTQPRVNSSAMAAYNQYATQGYGLNFDQSTISNPYYSAQNAYYQQMLQSQTAARQGTLQQTGGAQPPPNWETMPLDEFLRWAAQQRQQTQGPNRPQQPQNPNKPPAQNSPLQVHAHAKTNSNGQSVPVSYVRVNETGNYNSRQRSDNPAGYGEFDTTYGKAQMGKTYTVTVEWQDGSTRTTQVVNKGWPVEIW